MSFDRNFINIFKALSKKDQGVWEHMKASGKRNSESAASTRKVFRAWQKSGKPFDASHSFHRDNAKFGASKREGGTAKTVPEGSRLKSVDGRYAFVDTEGEVVRYLDTPEHEAQNRTRLDDSRGIGSSKRAKKVRRKNIRNAGVYDWKRGRRDSHPDEAGSPEDRASRPTTPSPETSASREVTPSPEKPASREEKPSLKPKEASKRIRRASQGGNNPAGGREVSKPPKTREDSTIQERKPKQGKLNLSLTKEYAMTETINIYKAFGIQSRTRPESNIGEALDLYDDVLQKADMDWDNVSEEDLVQLEKLFGLKNPLKREKSDKEKTERAGLDSSAVGGGKKETPNVGFSRTDQRRNREAAVQERRAKGRADVDASMKQPGKVSSRVDSLSRGLRSRTDAAKKKVSDAGSAVRDAGAGAVYGAAGGVDRASSAAAAGGRATNRAARTAGGAVRQEVGAGARATGRGLRAAGEAVEPAGSQRRRRGGPEARAQRNRAGGGGGIADQMGRGNQGGSGSNSRIASAARRAGSTVKRAAGDEWGRMKDTAEAGGVRGFINPKAPKAQASTGSKPKFGEAGYTNWKAMEKAVVSLQKFLDNDCGCEEDTLMQNARSSMNRARVTARRSEGKDRQGRGLRAQTGGPVNQEYHHEVARPILDRMDSGWGNKAGKSERTLSSRGQNRRTMRTDTHAGKAAFGGQATIPASEQMTSVRRKQRAERTPQGS